VERVKENAETVDLSEDDLKAIAVILDSFPVYGTRYPEPGMKLVEF
jgi:pyridoxine 4-dehydrogenase